MKRFYSQVGEEAKEELISFEFSRRICGQNRLLPLGLTATRRSGSLQISTDAPHRSSISSCQPLVAEKSLINSKFKDTL
jgi:hypothetical protein